METPGTDLPSPSFGIVVVTLLRLRGPKGLTCSGPSQPSHPGDVESAKTGTHASAAAPVAVCPPVMSQCWIINRGRVTVMRSSR